MNKTKNKILKSTIIISSLGAIAAAVAVPTVIFVTNQIEQNKQLSQTSYANLNQYGVPTTNGSWITGFYNVKLGKTPIPKNPAEIEMWAKDVTTYKQLKDYLELDLMEGSVNPYVPLSDNTNLKISYIAASGQSSSQIIIEMGAIGSVKATYSNDSWNWMFYGPLGAQGGTQSEYSDTPMTNLSQLDTYFKLDNLKNWLPESIKLDQVKINIQGLSTSIYNPTYNSSETQNNIQYIWLSSDSSVQKNQLINSLGAIEGNYNASSATWSWKYLKDLKPVSLANKSIGANGIPTNVNNISMLSYYLHLNGLYVFGLLSNLNVVNNEYVSNSVEVTKAANSLQKIDIIINEPNLNYESDNNQTTAIDQQVIQILGIYKNNNWEYNFSISSSQTIPTTLYSFTMGSKVIPAIPSEALSWANSITNYGELDHIYQLNYILLQQQIIFLIIKVFQLNLYLEHFKVLLKWKLI